MSRRFGTFDHPAETRRRKRITVDFPAEMFDRIEAKALREGTTKVDLVRRAVGHMLAERSS